MSPRKFRLAASVAAASALVIGGASLTSVTAQAADYAPIPQDQITLVDFSSEQSAAEAAANVLDGETSTFWHNQYSPAVAGERSLTFQLADEDVELGRFHLTPRQNSYSGLIREYEIRTASGDCTTANYTLRKSGLLPSEDRDAVRTIALDSPVFANCVQVVWISSYGGDLSVQDTATLAEFNADTGFEEAPEPGDPVDIVVEVPDGAVELADDDFRVRLHPDLPQVVDYRLGDE